ncbi:MAG: DUF5677 domain-containing protein [Candidatus Eisenbacteria bacterium]
MNWDSHRAVLDRELAVVNAKPFVDQMRPVLVEVVNYATNALIRCNTEAAGGSPATAAPLTLYHHMIEMADGIETLCGASAAVACVPLARSMFEAWLGLQWVLQNDASFEARGLAWVVGEARRELAMLEQLDRKAGRGKALRADLAKDRIARRIHRPPPAEIRAAIAMRKDALAAEEYVVTVSEHEAVKSRLQHEPEWFALNSGPKSIEQLARALELPGLYAVLYRDWSAIVHAADGSRYSASGPSGVRVIGHLREPEKLPAVTGLCVSFLVDATRLMLQKFRAGEEQMFARWYVDEVIPNLSKARAIKFGKSVLAPGGVILGRGPHGRGAESTQGSRLDPDSN